MKENKMSFDISMDGTLLSMPAKFGIGKQGNGVSISGIVQTDKMDLGKALGMIDAELAETAGAYLNTVTARLPERTYFRYRDNQCILWFRGGGTQIGILWEEKNVAVLCAVAQEDGAAEGSVSYYVTSAAQALGIEQMFLFLKKGEACELTQLARTVTGGEKTLKAPSPLASCNLLFCGSFCFDEDTVIGKAMDALFGIRRTALDMFFGVSGKDFSGYVLLPVFESGILTVEELYFGLGFKAKKAQMMLSGTFTFSFLEGVSFQVRCELNNQGFRIEAFAKPDKPIPLFHTFSIGDTCLAIGYQSGFLFQMFCNLYIGEIKLFGALGLTVTGAAVVLDMVSCAVTDITLPVFVRSIVGKQISGLETFDFIQLLGLPISINSTLPIKEDTPAEETARLFNERIGDKSFALSADRIQTERFQDGMVLTDKKRMRHYYIDKDGKVQLQAQLYYAMKDMVLGDYTITRGIFTCCTIRLFQKVEFQALLSLSETDGVMAYACIRNLDLGFLKLEGSGLNTQADNPLTNLPANSLLRQFVNPEEKGAVFYLRAGSNEVSFYIDAKLELLGLFCFAARILYAKGTVSVDTRFSLAGCMEVSLHIGADYANFSKADFSFELVVDCTGLEQKLRSVQDKINQAIDSLKNKVNSAKKRLTDAQNQVDELYGQIRRLDNNIDDCKKSIKNAKWYKKAFVAIAKGIEIAAYEVAKAGLYVAIGVAKAALEVAKQIVNIGGVVGESVLRAVNGAITATLNLFFVRYIRLASRVSTAEQNFNAEIEFVALGKTYHYQTTIGRSALSGNPTKALSDNINDRMNGDLNNIDKGAFRSNRNRYQHETYTIAQNKAQLRDGMLQIKSGTNLLCRMQENYVDSCGESMPEFEEFNVSYGQAMSDVSGLLELAERSVDFDNMNEAVAMVEEEMGKQEEKTRDTTFILVKKAIDEYKDSLDLLKSVRNGRGQLEAQQQTLNTHTETIKKKEQEYQKEMLETGAIPSVDMTQVLNRTEELIYEEFPISRNKKGMINLSREPLIHQYLDEARKEFGGEETEEIRKQRTRAAKGRYESRL
ncbi:MAG: hypothetical protein NC337_13270 [Roseburia sp.]|nr:hypothetical protein [Roseburia sp.]